MNLNIAILTCFTSLFLYHASLTSVDYSIKDPETAASHTLVDSLEKDKRAIAEMLKSKTPITWLFTGNSITQGAKHTHGMRIYSEIFFERVRYEMGRSRDLIVNTAVSGNTTKNILDDFDWRVAHSKPQVVFLMIGTNDAASDKSISVEQYGKNLENLIRKIRAIGAIPVVLSPTPILESHAPERANLKAYVVKMVALVKKEQVIFVNQWEIWNGELKEKYKEQWSRKLLNDPLHPNGQGHKEMAISLFKTLSIFDPKQPTCGGEYYEGYH